MEEMTAFHSKLSSIMEKLLVSAVMEIKQLVCDHCAVIHVELSREKQHNSVLRQELKLHQPVHSFMQGSEDGNDGARLQLQADQMESSTKDKGSSSFAVCKIEAVTVKCEAAPDERPQLTALPVRSPTCSDSPLPQDTDGQSLQSCSEPPENSRDLHTDCKHSVETLCQLSIAPSGDQFIDLGFHVKQESETPHLQTRGEDVNLGFELQRGILCQVYTDSGGFPVSHALPDPPAVTCFSSSEPSESQRMSGTVHIPDVSVTRHSADRDTSSHQGNPFESGTRSCDVATLRATQGTGRFKYTCDFCGKGFRFLSMMEDHRLSHTGERTQVCGQCGMSFIRRSHLTRHELLHLGVRPFTCQLCGRKFSRKAHLNKHMTIHCR